MVQRAAGAMAGVGGGSSPARLALLLLVVAAAVVAGGKVVHVEAAHRRSMLANGLGSAPPMGWVTFVCSFFWGVPTSLCAVILPSVWLRNSKKKSVWLRAHVGRSHNSDLISNRAARRWNSWNHFQCDGNGEVVIRETGRYFFSSSVSFYQSSLLNSKAADEVAVCLCLSFSIDRRPCLDHPQLTHSCPPDSLLSATNTSTSVRYSPSRVLQLLEYSTS